VFIEECALNRIKRKRYERCRGECSADRHDSGTGAAPEAKSNNDLSHEFMKVGIEEIAREHDWANWSGAC